MYTLFTDLSTHYQVDKYKTYEEAEEEIKESQEMDIKNCIGVTTKDRKDTLENETPVAQYLANGDYSDISDVKNEDLETFENWIVS
jgi:hypothetical protein